MTFPINAYSPCVNPDRRRQPCHPPPMPCPAPPHRAPPSPTPPKRGVGPQRRSAHDARNLVDIRTRQTGVRLRPNSTIPPPSRAPWPPRSSSARRSSSSRRSTTPASPSSTPPCGRTRKRYPIPPSLPPVAPANTQTTRNTGRQTLHHLQRIRPYRRRPAIPRLHVRRADGLPRPGRLCVLRREVRGACEAQGVAGGQGGGEADDDVLRGCACDWVWVSLARGEGDGGVGGADVVGFRQDGGEARL